MIIGSRSISSTAIAGGLGTLAGSVPGEPGSGETPGGAPSYAETFTSFLDNPTVTGGDRAGGNYCPPHSYAQRADWSESSRKVMAFFAPGWSPGPYTRMR